MPGVFSKDARPARPGAYFDFASQPQETVLPSTGLVCAVPITHDWGPANSVVATSSFADFQQKFGPTTTTAGYSAVKQCYKGEGLAGRGGAGSVLVYRVVGSAGQFASLIIQNTTPATALTLTAKYKGSYGNKLAANIQTNALDGAKKDLQILLNGTVVETYTYTPTDIVGLAALINAQSSWVTAVEAITGVALAATSNVSLASGNDGSTLIAGDWTTMQAAYEPQRFSVFAPFDLTDGSILTSLSAWAAGLNVNGKRFMVVTGGGGGDTVSSAITRSASIDTGAIISAGHNSENFVNLGGFTVVDAELGTLTSSQLAPRVAGILAARGEDKSLTFARLAGVTAGVLPTESQILQAFNGGVVVLGQDSNPDAPVRVEKGLTAYIGGDTNKPYLIYRNPKFVRTMHGIEIDITEWAATNAIGALQVNPNSRTFIVGAAKGFIQRRADRGVIQPGFSVSVDPTPPPSDSDEFVGLVYGVAFGRSIEQIYNLVYVS